MNFVISMSALGLLLLVGAQGTTIISIKYPPQGAADPKPVQPAKRDLSLSYAATNIDSKEGTRVKTITVIKNVGGIDAGDAGSSSAANIRQAKLAELHKNEEWAAAFRDNFESYGGLPEVPDIDDLFDFVNRKKTTKVPEKELKEQKPKVEVTTAKPKTTPVTPKATSEHAEVDSDEQPAEKITGDAELLPNHRMVNLLRLQPVEHNQKQPQQQESDQDKRVRTRESLINVNYSTPMHSVNQFYDKYIQVLPNGYDYSKPQPCAVPGPPNSIQVTTPSGRHYDIPQSNSSGTNGGINHPYVAPALAKRTQITPAPPAAAQPQPPPNYSSVNSLVPAIVQPQPQGSPPANGAQPPVQAKPQLPPQGVVGAAVGGAGGGLSTSQRPYVAPSLRNNGLGINRGPSTPPQTQPPPPLPAYPPGNANTNVVPNYHGNSYGSRPNTFRSRGLKY